MAKSRPWAPPLACGRHTTNVQWRERTVKARIKLLRKAGWRLRSTGACAGILASVALERKANRLSSACDKRPGSSISTSLLVEFYWLCVSETNKAASRPASDAQPHQNIQSKRSICLSWGGIKARCKKKKTQKNRRFMCFCPKHKRVAFLWPIYQGTDRATWSARRIMLKAEVGKMTAACENWHTRLFQLGPGEPEHKITSVPSAFWAGWASVTNNNNNRETGRGEGRSY